MISKIVLSVLAISSSLAQAADFTYQCHQVRTTAEERTATTRLKSVKLFAYEDGFELSTDKFQISEIDMRLMTGGAPLTHVDYGGCFTSTLSEVFVCKRPMLNKSGS